MQEARLILCLYLYIFISMSMSISISLYATTQLYVCVYIYIYILYVHAYVFQYVHTQSRPASGPRQAAVLRWSLLSQLGSEDRNARGFSGFKKGVRFRGFRELHSVGGVAG